MQNIGGGTDVHPSLNGFYGVTSLADMVKPEKAALAKEASAINHATPDDPPVYLTYETQLLSEPHPGNTPSGVVVHSPRMGLFLKEKLDELGVECEFHHLGNPDNITDQIAFLIKHLQN